MPLGTHTTSMPVQVNGHFEARWPPDMSPGAELNVPMSFNIVLHLPPGLVGNPTATPTCTQ